MPQNQPRSASGGRKKKKSRRYRLRKAFRIGILVAVPLLLIAAGLAFWNLVYIPHKKAEEKARSESISISESIQRQQTWTEDVNAIQAAQGVGDITWSVLDHLKTQALSGYSLDTATGELSRPEQNVTASDQAFYFLENLGNYDDAILTFYLSNPERFEFVKAYPQRESLQTPPETLTESLDSVPHLLQWDTRWGYLPYGDSTMYYAGCAPTSLSMALSYLKKDPSITPALIKQYADENGYYVSGAGSSHALLDEYPAVQGVDVERIDLSQRAISEALAQGKVLIFNMTPGTFTQVGHFMVVDKEENGQLSVVDPNSIWRTKLWNYDEVLPTTAAIWALGPAPADAAASSVQE